MKVPNTVKIDNVTIETDKGQEFTVENQHSNLL